MHQIHDYILGRREQRGSGIWSPMRPASPTRLDRQIPWADLHLKMQENLIHFLDVDLDLTGTLCDSAKSHPDPEHRTQLIRNIKQAIDTLRYFARGVVDACTRETILDRVDELEFKADKMTQVKRPGTATGESTSRKRKRAI